MIEAIVVPQGAEYKAVKSGINKTNNSRLPIIAIPIGFNQTEIAAKIAYLKSLKIKKLVMMGLCGGLSPKYSVGDIVIYQTCFEPNQQITLETDFSLTNSLYEQLSDASLVTGFTSDRFINLAQEKQQIYGKYQTDVIDMEGFSYLHLLKEHNIAIAILRVVSDDCRYDVPDLSQAINERGILKNLPLTIAMLKQPLAAIRFIKGSLQGLQILENIAQKTVISYQLRNNCV